MLTNWTGSLIFAFREGPEAEVAASGGVDMGTLGIIVVIAIVIGLVYMTKADSKAAMKRKQEEQEFYKREDERNNRSHEAGVNDVR